MTTDVRAKVPSHQQDMVDSRRQQSHDDVGMSRHLVRKLYMYSRTSMARTSLGPWKFVRDMGSSSH